MLPAGNLKLTDQSGREFPLARWRGVRINPVGEEDEAGYTAVESAVVSGAKKAVSKGGSKAKAGRDWPDGKIG